MDYLEYFSVLIVMWQGAEDLVFLRIPDGKLSSRYACGAACGFMAKRPKPQMALR